MTDFVDPTFKSEFYLNPNEQDLLITALNSNKPTGSTNGLYNSNANRSNSNNVVTTSQSNMGSTYASPTQQTPGSGTLANRSFEDSPFGDFDLDESNFDWDGNTELIGALPGSYSDDHDHDENEPGDKRRNPDDGDEEDGGGKRREGEDKTGKKPGRKPLTSEPTSKRKAQNRAAQRAFRERKEKHLKDLETKVDELEKASDSANHENGLLRAQVERLQTELREYRKRVSLGASLNRSPQTQSVGQPFSSKANWDINNNFQFEFPRFGAQPGSKPSQPKHRSSTGSSANAKVTNNGYTASPKSFSNSVGPRAGSTPGNVDDLSALFSPSVLASVSSRSNSTDYVSFPQTNQPLQMNPSSTSDANYNPASKTISEPNTASPASSGSHNGFTSSNVTTPESSAESPEQRKAGEAAFNSIAEGSKRQSMDHQAFCKEFQTACGTKENPIPPMLSHSNDASASPASNAVKTPNLDFPGIDWFASQNGNAFDPVLFGDYRDPQESIMNSEFGFFSDAFPMPDFGSPPVQPLETNLPKKRDLMQEMEEAINGKDQEVVPGETPTQYLTCTKLWDHIQKSEKVQSGEADMDELCSQLKAKAKCSGNGAVIEQKDVDAILGPVRKPGQQQNDFLNMFR